MKCTLKSEQPVTNEAAKAATGKTLDQWFAELDKSDGLKLGRREINNRLNEQKLDPWWCTTIAVEYEKHHDLRKKDGLFEGYFVCSTKTIAAPPAEVFKAWSNGATLSKWFGDDTKAEVKDGGTLESKDGDKGKFLRVRENKDIRMTFENKNFSAPTQVDVQFQDKGKGKTGLLVNHTRIQTREEADGLRAAWAQALDQLKAVCES
ncbi:MAG TPA: SRPBCC domain-containing protein [Pyrinomonadaceae bacterium]|nr:SRPBCC domain-containing protein [Pyrinomonadaceae bacterium]